MKKKYVSAKNVVFICIPTHWHAWSGAPCICKVCSLRRLQMCFGSMAGIIPKRKRWRLNIRTWGRGWMTKASGVGERRKGRGELRRDCHHRVAALFVPTRMQQWYMIYNNDIYGGGGRGGPFAGKITWCPWGAPEYVLKQEDSSELTLAFVIMTIIANNDKM